MIFDTHTHCYFESLAPHIEWVIAEMRANGIQYATQIGCDIRTSQQAIQLAEGFPDVFRATVGFHPETASHMSIHSGQIEILEQLIQEHRASIVAVGECGLDFHYLDGTDGGKVPMNWDAPSEQALQEIENQKYWWGEQWQLAKRYGLPLVIHTRDARDATLEYMQSHQITYAVMHCYSEDPAFASTLMELSDTIYFSFSGILTYKKSTQVQETARMLPLDRILIETDAPFLAPQAVRGQVCQPSFTRYTLEYLSSIRPESLEEIEARIYENSLRFYQMSGV